MNAVIFATEREAAPFINRLSAKRVSSLDGLHVYRPRRKSVDLVVLVSGMGRADARHATQYALDVLDADRVVNAGVSGALTDKADHSAVYAVNSVAAEDGGQTFLIDQPGWQGLESRSLVTVDRPVFGGARRETLGKEFELADMEGYAIAEVCGKKGVPCVLVKGVTDFAGDDGKADIQQNIDAVSIRVASAVLTGLDIKAGMGAFVRLSNFVKVEHTIFSLPLLLCGAWIGSDHSLPSWRVIGLVFLAGLGARTLGMSLNRILDRDVDAKNARTAGRELPSGKMSLLHAYSVAAAGLLVYLLACAGLGPVCLYLAPVPLIPLGLYSLLKRFTSLCHFGIGVCLGMAPLGAYVAASGGIDFNREILLLGLYSFCWISGFDIIYALQDIDFDRKVGLRSLPASLGVRGAGIVAACVHLLGMLAAAGVWYYSGGGVAAGIAFAVAGGFTLAGHLKCVSLQARFFPCSAFAGVAGAMISILGGV